MQTLQQFYRVQSRNSFGDSCLIVLLSGYYFIIPKPWYMP